MIRRFPKIIILAILCSIVIVLPSFAAGPWKGQVIDIETKEPLEGSVVLAIWRRTYRTPTGPNSYFYNAKEVLTDKDGKFVMSSYTPINLLPLISYIEDDPEFIIFKPGYGSLRMAIGQYLTGEVPKDFMTGQVKTEWEFELSGKKYRLSPGIIELPPLKTREERLNSKRTADIFGLEIKAKQLPLLHKSISEENEILGLK